MTVANLVGDSPECLVRISSKQGWTALRVEHDLAFFCTQIDGDDLECDVPLRESASDYPRRVRELLENLTLIEGRSQYDIYQDLIRANQDAV